MKLAEFTTCIEAFAAHVGSAVGDTLTSQFEILQRTDPLRIRICLRPSKLTPPELLERFQVPVPGRAVLHAFSQAGFVHGVANSRVISGDETGVLFDLQFHTLRIEDAP